MVPAPMKLLTFLARRFAWRSHAKTLADASDDEVATTPFGWFCEWDLAVYGESLAKVWKEV